ncbi:MAG TPA: DNA translocase FtsK, partial [Chromatiales bacterium]|nr:DNA translocase FtsK [Chromatiales bacterium]
MRGRVIHLLREGAGLLVLAVALLLLLSLLSYDPGDPGWSHTGTHSTVHNLGGAAGAWIADLLFYLLGYLAFLAPPMIGWSGWLVVRGEMREGQTDWSLLAVRWAGFLVMVVSGCALATMHFLGGGLPQHAGGVLGEALAGAMVPELSIVGASLLLTAMFLAGVTLAIGLSWGSVAEWIGHWALVGTSLGLRWVRRWQEAGAAERARRERRVVVEAERRREKRKRRKVPRIEPALGPPEPGERAERERQIPLLEIPADTELPPLSLLDPPRSGEGGYSESALEAMSRLVELKLRDFGVNVEVEAVHPGPVITRFELQPAPGVKASRISGLAKDLARSLSVASVRIVEVIPGKTVVGLEIPNEKREIIALQEILASREYEQSGSPLTLALGKDIGGKPVVADLARMPHLLVAGTTGSGKSVAINSML